MFDIEIDTITTKALVKQNASLTFVMPKRVDLDLDFMKRTQADDCPESNKIMKEYYFNSPLQAYSPPGLDHCPQ